MIPNLYRQPQSLSSQNPTMQRVPQARGTRLAQPRNRFPGQPRTISAQARNSLFPPNMDVEMHEVAPQGTPDPVSEVLNPKTTIKSRRRAPASKNQKH
ncbi:unnamed protein product [Ilex paraguariensis]|uniref:Uncharacterized protein n=1 Tax=Ilex paraguariensis TaxID=185542 RepID=A0ABC8UD12_9AQUA